VPAQFPTPKKPPRQRPRPRPKQPARPAPSAPTIPTFAGRRVTFVKDLKGLHAVDQPGLHATGFFDLTVGQIIVGVKDVFVRFPTAGRWELGVVQNLEVHKGTLRYVRGLVRWFSGAPLLDTLAPGDIWAPPLRDPTITTPNPLVIDVKTPGEVVGPLTVLMGDEPFLPIKGLGGGKCGRLERAVVAIAFRAGIAARLRGKVSWLATSQETYGFVVVLDVNANGDYVMESRALEGGELRVPAKAPLVLSPPNANTFMRRVINRAFSEAGC
jgi:hypothetical protein